MAHVHLLAAWQHNDIDKIKQLISKRVHVFLTKENGVTIEMNYETLIALMQQAIEVAKKTTGTGSLT